MNSTLRKYTDSLYGELSLATSGGDGGVDDESLSKASLNKRLRIQFARAAVKINPSAVGAILTAPYRSRGYEVVGFGFNSTTLRMGDTVLKVMRRTADLDTQEQKQLLDTLILQQDIVKQHLAEYIEPQQFSIEPHPISRRSVLVARQAFRTYSDFDTHSTRSLPPIIQAQTYDFADKSLNMANTTGYVPDILGGSNLVFSDEELLLLDSVPTSRDANNAGYNKNVQKIQTIMNDL
ncbi:hypothetical protein A2791_00830 [Candidatus Saccharibacteria bacterium RIFCSPHIGHO2_01_FULL_46_30]|nr:MAG: hypothetical protein A2791_00830 [Candidatus Saccharibacteria bacterium RIFCSPHIGHO2_01_FULL_46_30]